MFAYSGGEVGVILITKWEISEILRIRYDPGIFYRTHGNFFGQQKFYSTWMD